VDDRLASKEVALDPSHARRVALRREGQIECRHSKAARLQTARQLAPSCAHSRIRRAPTMAWLTKACCSEIARSAAVSIDAMLIALLSWDLLPHPRDHGSQGDHGAHRMKQQPLKLPVAPRRAECDEREDGPYDAPTCKADEHLPDRHDGMSVRCHGWRESHDERRKQEHRRDLEAPEEEYR
jgi:hypothetical protein